MIEMRKYRVKKEWIFNLESMQDKLACIEMDIEEGKLDFPLTITGLIIEDWDDFEYLKDECADLEYKSWYKVTSSEYGRIKEIVEWRVQQRYNRCIASGMSEKDAGMCFQDL